MLPTQSLKHPPPRKNNRPYTRKPAPMVRSASILSTIRNIVTAPLSWLAGTEEFKEDTNGKRRRSGAGDVASDAREDGGVAKKMRVESPPRSSGYLDPPERTFAPPPRLYSHSSGSKMDLDVPSPTALAGPAIALTRTMSIDPPARNSPSIVGHATISIPRHSSMAIVKSASLSRDMSLPPSASFRLRTSLTPQPSPKKGIRREASAPPPLASLMSNPIFVKPPPEPSRPLDESLTMPLGSLAEISRSVRACHGTLELTRVKISQQTRSPSRNPSLARMDSFTSEIPNNVRVTNLAEKTLLELDVYKTPIVPTRYKEAKVIPQFLKPRKAHVPIPMTSKGRAVKPSLGLTAPPGKEKATEKGEGKPYSGQGGLSKLLARRRAEEEDERSATAMDDDEGGNMGTKRDVGVNVHLTSDSEEGPTHRHEANDLATRLVADLEIPSLHGRERASGRVGPTRTSRIRENVQRSVPLGKKTNKFSAAFDDDEATEDIFGADTVGSGSREQTDAPEDQPPKEAVVYKAPAGFSFAKNTAPITHTLDGEKEPPIAALPFSLGAVSSAPMTQEPVKRQLSPFVQTSVPDKKAPLGSVDIFGSVDKDSVSLGTAANSATTDTTSVKPLALPQVMIVPPTPEISSTVEAPKPTPFGSSPFVTKPASSSSGGIPNFFANSPFLANKPATSSPLATAPPLTSSPPVPVKDAENPFWDGDKALQSTKSSSMSVSSGTVSFGGLEQSTPTPAASPFNFGSGTSTPTSLFGGPTQSDKPTFVVPVNPAFSFGAGSQNAGPQPSVKTSVGDSDPAPGISSSSVTSGFSFGTPSSSQTTAATTTTSSASVPSMFDTAPPAPAKMGSIEPPKLPFSFGAPAALASSSGTTQAQTDSLSRPSFGSGRAFTMPVASGSTATVSAPEASKSPFAFGTPPATPPPASDRKEPFPAFGSVTTSSTAPAFGTPSKPAVADPATTSPFTFGAPPARPSTPPRLEEKEMRMEESPTRDENGPVTTNKPSTGFSFALNNNTPFGSGGSSSSTGSALFGGFGDSVVSNPFAPKEELKAPSFANFNRTTSAPVISTTTFSFGQKPDPTAPTSASALPSQPNPFVSPSTATQPFTFGGTTTAGSNPFATSGTQTNTLAPSSPSTFQQSNSFSFAPSSVSNNPFSFGGSQPSSPAAPTSGLPQSPSTSSNLFTFGASSGAPQPSTATPFGAPPSGGTLFNIGAAPPAPGNNARQVKKLPRRGGAKR